MCTDLEIFGFIFYFVFFIFTIFLLGHSNIGLVQRITAEFSLMERLEKGIRKIEREFDF